MTSSHILPWRTRWSVRLGTWLLRALAATWRIRVHGRTSWVKRQAQGDGAVLLSLWHGQMLPVLIAHLGEPTTVLVSEHRDGEIIAQILRAFGMTAERGSTSRGGARALLSLAQIVREGRDIAITPDGPRGPKRVMAPGVLLIAHRTGAPVVPLVAATDRCWRLRSWDAFEIPKPFARVTVLYDAPRRVEAASARDAAARVQEFAGYMADATTRVAQLHAGTDLSSQE